MEFDTPHFIAMENSGSTEWLDLALRVVATFIALLGAFVAEKSMAESYQRVRPVNVNQTWDRR